MSTSSFQTTAFVGLLTVLSARVKFQSNLKPMMINETFSFRLYYKNICIFLALILNSYFKSFSLDDVVRF